MLKVKQTENELRFSAIFRLFAGPEASDGDGTFLIPKI